jgi:hypothetical protein
MPSILSGLEKDISPLRIIIPMLTNIKSIKTTNDGSIPIPNRGIANNWNGMKKAVAYNRDACKEVALNID